MIVPYICKKEKTLRCDQKCATIVLMDDTQSSAAHSDAFENIAPIEWTASEYISHEKSISWHGALFAAAAVLIVIVFVVSRDILSTIVIALSAVAMSVYAKKKPEQKAYRLDDQGVSINDSLYPYAAFKSFSIVEEGSINSIWLKPLQRFSPTTVIYFPPDQEEAIEDLLSHYLPFEQKSMDAIDRITRRIRF